jgi:hypothetical protein
MLPKPAERPGEAGRRTPGAAQFLLEPEEQPGPVGGPDQGPPATTTKSNCDPNYAGACVPIASDVDCEGGGGNGPAYLSGTAEVVGSDIYDLDRDGDGVACDT